MRWLRSVWRTVKVLVVVALALPILLIILLLLMGNFERGSSTVRLAPTSAPLAADGCGSRGGPGYRLESGRCASHEDAAAKRR